MKLQKTGLQFVRKYLTFKYDIVAPIIATILVLISGTFISFLVAQNQTAQNRSSQDEYLTEQQQLISDNITQRISAYEQALISGASLFKISQDVNRQQWNIYAEGLNVEERFPGTAGIGYIERVPMGDVEAFESRMRQQGLEGYHVYPRGGDAVYFPNTFIEPLNESTRAMLGFDQGSETTRSKTLETARDSGQLAMTPPLAPQPDANGQDGTVVIAYYPVYRGPGTPQDEASRRDRLQGYTFVLLEMDHFGSEVYNSLNHDSRYELLVSDVSDDAATPLFTSPNFTELEGSSETVVSSRELSVLGRTWEVKLLLDAERFGLSQVSPFLVFTLGMVVNAAAAAFLFMTMIHRQARLVMAHEQEVQKTKDDLLALASHQLRTPATGVKQYVGMVLAGYAGRITREQREMLTRANESNERQLEIINQLLYVAKVDAGQLKVEPERFSIVEVTQQVIEEHKVHAAEKQIKVHMNKARPAYVTADIRHVRMVLENLVSNAIKYSYEKGNVRVAIENHRDHVLVHVTDKGVGISEEDMPQLFKKFSRIENKLSKRVGGSGIGLFLSQQLAQANGGNITVRSTPEKGSTFSFYLPKKPKT